MIKLLETSSPSIVVGLVDHDLNVISSNNILGHYELVEKHPEWLHRDVCHWRFNANNNTLYWYQEPPNEDMKNVVKDEIKRKHPYFHVLKQYKMDSNDILNYNKRQMVAHGLDRYDEIFNDKNYHNKMTDDERQDNAEHYFSIGQMDDDPNIHFCWIYINNLLYVKRGRT